MTKDCLGCESGSLHVRATITRRKVGVRSLFGCQFAVSCGFSEKSCTPAKVSFGVSRSTESLMTVCGFEFHFILYR